MVSKNSSLEEFESKSKFKSPNVALKVLHVQEMAPINTLKPDKTNILLNMVGLNNERMVISLNTDISVEDISIALVHQKCLEQMMIDGRKGIQLQNIHLFYHGIALSLNKTFKFYDISNDGRNRAVIYARHAFNGGMNNSNNEDITTYSTQVKNFGGNKIYLSEDKREMFLNLTDARPLFPKYIVERRIRLLYRKRKNFTLEEIQRVQRCIKGWAQSNLNKNTNSRLLVAFSLQKIESGMNSVKVEGELAALHAFVCKKLQLKLNCDSKNKQPVIRITNIQKSQQMNHFVKSSNNNNIRKIKTSSLPISKKDQTIENWEDTNPLKWTIDDVQAWFASIGSSEIYQTFKKFNGAQLLALLQNENEIQRLLGDSFHAASALTKELRNIVKENNISNNAIKNAAKKPRNKANKGNRKRKKSSVSKDESSIDYVDSFWRQFSIGDKMEVCDIERKWCLSEIIDIKGSKFNIKVPRTFCIAYDGWSERWNQTIPVDASTVCNCTHACTERTHKLTALNRQSVYATSPPAKPKPNIDKKLPKKVKYKKLPKKIKPKCKPPPKPKNLTGVVPLKNQGNTCYMNSSIQAILQTPELVRFLRAHVSSSGSSNNSGSGSGNSSCSENQRKPKNKKKWKKNRKQSLPYGMSLLDAFGDLAKEAADGETVRPSNIRSILSSINPRFGNGQQDDTSLVLSTILAELDKNCATEFAAKNNESIVGRYNANYSITLEEELDSDDEEFYIEEDILPTHNPFNSLIRKTMDGVEKVITTCMACDYKKINYSTFREIQLPLMSSIMTLEVEVCIPSLNQTLDTKKYQVLNYCSIDVLRMQIVREIESKSDMRPSLNSVTICTLFTNKKNMGNIDDWMYFYGSDALCSDLPLKVIAIIDNESQSEMKNNSNEKYLMKFEIVLNRNGNPENVPLSNHSQFICLVEDRTYAGKQLLDENYKNSELSKAKKSGLEMQIFLGNRFVLASEKYLIRNDMKLIVLLWTPSQMMSSVWPSFGKTIFNLEKISEAMFQTAICDNEHSYDLIGIEEQLRQRYNKVSNCTSDIYSDSYIEILYDMSEMAKNILQNERKVAEFLKPQISHSVQHWKRPHPMSNISQPLQLYEQSIILDEQRGNFYCNVCQTNARVFKEQRTIVYAPQNLILVIDRYGEHERSGKLNHLVRYPVSESLVLGRQTKAHYKLFATCDHSSSSMDSGHYIANVKSINTGGWFYTSDAHVRSINTQDVLSKHSIVLLFAKE